MRRRLRKEKYVFRDLERAEIDLALVTQLWLDTEPDDWALWSLSYEVQYNLFNPFLADVTVWATRSIRRHDD